MQRLDRQVTGEIFPSVFGPKGGSAARYGSGASEVRRPGRGGPDRTGKRLEARAVAEGFLAIAVDNMANAIEQVSVARGYDVTRYTLACFGGAGGQHACLVADALGMTSIMIHPLAGCSPRTAWASANIEALAPAERSRKASASGATPLYASAVRQLARTATEEVVGQGVAAWQGWAAPALRTSAMPAPIRIAGSAVCDRFKENAVGLRACARSAFSLSSTVTKAGHRSGIGRSSQQRKRRFEKPRGRRPRGPSFPPPRGGCAFSPAANGTRRHVLPDAY